MNQKIQNIRGTNFPKTLVPRGERNPDSNPDEIYNETGKLAYVIAKAKQRISKEDYKIFEKYNDQMILDGLSTNTRHRALTMFLRLTTIIHCEWKDVAEPELRKIVSHIMSKHAENGQETGYTASFKKALKSIVRFIHTGNRNLVKHVPELLMLQFIVTNQPPEKLTREDLPTKEELTKLLAVCVDSTRDKAMFAVHAEAGTRVGELLKLNIKNFVIDKYGGLLKVNGKTGIRSIRIVTSVPYVTRWLNDHPDKNNPAAPLWIYIRNENTFGNRITYAGFNKILKKRVKQARISKRMYSHLFRHAEVTQLAGVLTEAESRMRHGWGRKSTMPSKYAHMNQEELDDKILQHIGIKKTEVKEEPLKECVYCKINYPLEIKYCNICSRPLDIIDALEMEQESKDKTQAMIYELMREEKAKAAKNNYQNKRDKQLEIQMQAQETEIQMLKNMITKMSKAE